MPTLRLTKPSEKQKLFLTDTHKVLNFGGSRGGGKSWSVRTDAIIKCLQYPGIKIMIVRKTYPELQANHIGPLIETLRCYSDDPVAKYNDQKKTITFPNGSTILFKYLDTDKDAERFQGTETDILYVDEATQQTEENIKKLTACVRGVNSFPHLIRYTCNPGNVGHGWVKRLFIDKEYKDGENPDDYGFIQSSVYDNYALMKSNPDYVKQLEALPPHLRDMWLYGRWDITEGMFFDDFRTVPDVMAAHDHGVDLDAETLKAQHRWTHVIEPFDLNEGERTGWHILRSYDFGYGKPFSCAWWAVDYEGVMYRILEWYGCTETPNEGVKLTPDEQFKHIHEIEMEHPWLKGRRIDGVADPAIWDASHGISIAETANKYYVDFQRGDNARLAGWMQFHYRMQFDENGYSRMYVFDTCKAFIRTIPLMMYDEHKPEDLDTDLEDHVADESRYAFMSRPIQPLHQVERKRVLFDPLDQFKEKYY